VHRWFDMSPSELRGSGRSDTSAGHTRSMSGGHRFLR
jgi:hypothetical protein